MQSQDRHLFLFSDLLLIAKARSGGNFKLKQSVRMSELWLTAGHIEDVAETSKSQETSFVLGWPTTNVVATFMYVTTDASQTSHPRLGISFTRITASFFTFLSTLCHETESQ